MLVDGNVFSGIEGKAIAREGGPQTHSVISTNLLIDSNPGVPAAKFNEQDKSTNYTD